MHKRRNRQGSTRYRQLQMIHERREAIIQDDTVHIGLQQLKLAVAAVDQSAFLIPQRILRRVIRQHARLQGIGRRVPHRKSYVISAAELLSIASAEELNLPVHELASDAVILLVQPSPEQLESRSEVEVLVKYWRLLFHATIHRLLAQQSAMGRLGLAEVRDRIARIGRLEFDEARAVLGQESFLLEPTSDIAVYVEFAAVFCELWQFAPDLLHSYFPAMRHLDEVAQVLRMDVDAEAAFHDTRLPGAPEAPHQSEVKFASRSLPPRPESRYWPMAGVSRKLMKKAARVSGFGNVVRASLMRIAAAGRASTKLARRARAEARLDMKRLAEGLQAVIGCDDAERENWEACLMLLASQSAGGTWTAESRILYDLQKACVDHERGIYTFDLYRWIASGFRIPVKRPLPGQGEALIFKNFRRAARRLASLRMAGVDRGRLAALLHSALHRKEGKLRARFRPVLAGALDDVQLLPKNLPERAARNKLVEELLDRITDRGYLLMGDVRDALSRNSLKIPDVTTVRQLWWGDQLLELNRLLAERLEGVYRRGEIYLTFSQRLSSLAFGTRIGRFLTRYIALPFGGAFLLQKGLQHLIMPRPADESWHAASITLYFALSLFLLGVLHHQDFRTACISLLWSIGRMLRYLCVKLPSKLFKLPLVEAIRKSPYFRFATQYLLKPLAIAVLIEPVIALTLPSQPTQSNWLVAFLTANLILNSQAGRNAEEWITDQITHNWHRFRIRVLGTLLRWIMDAFSRMVEAIERVLYGVDEWLRFRSGETVLVSVTKAVLGPIWRLVNGFIRFCLNLLIEPQINPIKHFPVVTVSHKILLPLTVPFARLLEGPLSTAWANTVAPIVVLLVPGIFGFLVWELTENWRLYAANRPHYLNPVRIGHHGETMVKLMRPGFRSGTLPKLFARLRQAKRKPFRANHLKLLSKHMAGLHRVEEHVRRFVNRDLLLQLRHSRSWSKRHLAAGAIELATNRVLVEVRCPELAEDCLWLSFEEEAGWLVAAVHRRGWLDALAGPSRTAFENALAGCYKFAGVDLVREQLAAIQSRGIVTQIDRAGILAYQSDSPHNATRYRLDDWPPRRGEREVEDRPPGSPFPADDQIIFARTPISWELWVFVWESEQSHERTARRVLQTASLLPSIASSHTLNRSEGGAY